MRSRFGDIDSANGHVPIGIVDFGRVETDEILDIEETRDQGIHLIAKPEIRECHEVKWRRETIETMFQQPKSTITTKDEIRFAKRIKHENDTNHH
jgi:hypothetical protein